ncbi:MAG: hypothetical protein AAF628_31565 [Planctomycetota bacterium]
MSADGLSAAHERLLESIAAGDRSLEDPLVAKARRDPGFARELDRLLSVRDELRAAADAERAALSALDDPPPFEGADDLVRVSVTQHSGNTVRPATGRRTWVAAMVAAAALVAVTVWWWSSRARPSPGPWLSGGIRCVAPVGDVAEYGPFRWQYTLPAGGYFEVRVLNEERAEVGASPPLEDDSWTPTDPLPPRIRWHVRAYSVTGEELATGQAEAALAQ